jgi:hypothetical protein
MTDPVPTSISAPDPTGAAATGDDVVARGDWRYRLKWVGLGLLFLAGAGWFLYDGYVGWPRANAEARQKAEAEGKAAPEKLKTDLDIRLQKIIGYSLIPLSLFVVFRGLHGTRGVYRLAGDTLHVPGHPPVPFDAIRAIDQSKWKRKGIAYIDYELNGKTARLTLDNYRYEVDPTEEIHNRILAAVAPEEADLPAGSNTAAPPET